MKLRSSLFLWLSLSIRLYNWARVEGAFLQQPQNTTVTDSSEVTFRCSVFNHSSFIILWLLNGSDAGLDKFKDRGVNANFTDTSSQLSIVGYQRNNNTRVQCRALQSKNYSISFLSEVALLLVLDDNSPIQSWTSQLSSSLTRKTPEAMRTQTQQTIPSSPKVDPPRLENKALPLALGTVSIAILLILAIHGIAIVILWHRRKRKVGGMIMPISDTDKSPETCSDIKLQVNVVYEHRKPLKLQHNPAYQYCHPPQ